MKFFFLGTSACDFSQKLLTECKDRFDKDARRASCALIGGRYLIDCGLHVLDSLRIAQKDPAQITDIFITHFHSDHFQAENVKAIASMKKTPLRLWVSKGAVVPKIENVSVQYMPKLSPCKVDESLQVVGLFANHQQSTFPQHLLFELSGKKIFYALDGAWIVNENCKYLQNADLDMLVLDATCGDYEGDYRVGEHNSIPMARLLIASLKTLNVVGEKTKIYLSHLAPSLHKPHSETESLVAPLKVAYDGLEIEL